MWKINRKRLAVELITTLIFFLVLIATVMYGKDIDSATGYKEPVPVNKPVQAIPNKTKERMSEYIQSKNITVYPTLANMIADSILNAEEVYGIPRLIMLALIEVESGYNYAAVSDSGAIGLTQVHTSTWLNESKDENLKNFKVISDAKDLYDPVKNIMAGAFILNKYYQEETGKKNPMQGALTRYYGGVKNSHYDKVCQRIGEFYVFNLLTNQSIN